MDNLAKSSESDTELDQMKTDVDNALKGSGQTIKFKPEDAEGGQKPAVNEPVEKKEEPKEEPESDDKNSGDVPQTTTPSKPGASL